MRNLKVNGWNREREYMTEKEGKNVKKKERKKEGNEMKRNERHKEIVWN